MYGFWVTAVNSKDFFAGVAEKRLHLERLCAVVIVVFCFCSLLCVCPRKRDPDGTKSYHLGVLTHPHPQRRKMQLTAFNGIRARGLSEKIEANLHFLPKWCEFRLERKKCLQDWFLTSKNNFETFSLHPFSEAKKTFFSLHFGTFSSHASLSIPREKAVKFIKGFTYAVFSRYKMYSKLLYVFMKKGMKISFHFA